MKSLRFKTNINCSGCTARVTPVLNKTFGEQSWEVDTTIPEKILTVHTSEASPQDVVKALKKIGFTAEELA